MTWLYYAIFPGGHGRMDAAVERLLDPACALIGTARGVDRWFFIRYFDERGPHLRLRAHAARRDDADALQRRLDGLMGERLAAVAGEEPQPRRPLLPTPAAQAAPSAAHVGFEQRIYEPEWEKYGDPAGVGVAERLFQVSSRVVLDSAAARLGSGPRAALSLALMSAVARVGVPRGRRAGFWGDYGAYWTSGGGGTPAPGAARFIDRAAARVAPLLEPARAALAADRAASAGVARYADAADAMLAAARADRVARTAEHLCFHHVHMTNNRLGMTLVEEALLAGVLARHHSEEAS